MTTPMPRPTVGPPPDAAAPERLVELLNGRFPFPILDRFVAHADGGGSGVKLVSAGEPYFPGHFPDDPVLPGVLVIGGLALVAAGVAASDGLVRDVGVIERFRFRRPVRPGDRLDLRVRRLEGAAGRCFQAEASVDGIVVAGGRLVLDDAGETA
jgi:3-hydroxyacyl-[acyl-carrier-protein] dehydratase